MNPRQVISIFAMIFIALGVLLWYAFFRRDSVAALPEKPEYFRLTSEKELMLWETEHLSSVIESQLLPFFFNSIQEKNKKLINSLLNENAKFSITARPSTFVLDPNFIQVNDVDALSSKKTANRKEFVSFLMNLHNDLKSVIYPHVRLTKIEKLDDSPSRWRIGFRIEVDGLGQDDLPLHILSDHLVELDITDEKKIVALPAIMHWSVVKVDRYRTEKFFFEEFTETYNLKEVILFDDWIVQLANSRKKKKKNGPREPEKVVAFHGQIAVVDINRDGFPELIVATPVGTPMLFENRASAGFHEITGQSGLKKWDTNEGSEKALCSWIDYNNDGLPDLLLGNLLFKNNGNGKFSDVTTESGISIFHGCNGAIVADYDCDGFQDLYLIYDIPDLSSSLAESWVSPNSIYKRNVLLHNEGDGTFLDVSIISNSDGGRKATRSAAWIHYNDDKYPDLVLANYLGESSIIINNGDGTFRELNSEKGIAPFGFTSGVSVGDIDNDGFSDIFINSLFSHEGIRIIESFTSDDFPQGVYDQLSRMVRGSFLFKYNSEQKKYSEVTKKWNAFGDGMGFGSTFLDIQNDGWLDLYATEGLKSFDRFKPDGAANWWKGIFISPEFRYSIVPPPDSIKKKLDYQKGEFWVENPHYIPAFRYNLFSFQRNRFLLNVQGKKFIDTSFASGANIDSDSRSPIAADFDRDGATDLIVGSIGGGALRLFLNRLPQQNRIRLELTGTESNKMAIGSKVIVHCGNRKIYRDFFPANGFQGMGPAELIVGVGKAEKIDKLEIRWPNGKKQEFQNIPVNKIVFLEEGNDSFKTKPFLTVRSKKKTNSKTTKKTK